MPEYSKGKIYMIYSTDSPVLLPYYGSTTYSLKKRGKEHKAHFKQWKQGKKTGCSSFMLLEQGFDKVAIILVEDYPCNSKQELEIREAHYIKNSPCINKNLPSGIVAESLQDYKKQYYQANQDKILEQKKQYRQANQDKILEQNKQYRDKQREKIVCECGAVIRRDSLARHRRSKKHQQWLEQQPKPKPKITITIKIKPKIEIKTKPKPNPTPKSKPESVPIASNLVGI